MSYFTLPKINNLITINPITNKNAPLIYTSHSLHSHYENLYEQLKCICEIKENAISLDDLLMLINPYEYIYSNVPGSKFSVSKLHTKANVFYDLYEILCTTSLFDNYKNYDIACLYVTPNYKDLIYCNELIREDNKDIMFFFENTDNDFNLIMNDAPKFDFMFFEINENEGNDLNLYTIKLLKFLKHILSFQNQNGSCIIKIHNVFYKPLIDIIYILSTIYEKTNVIKPLTSNISSFEKYIVCKKFIQTEYKLESYSNCCREIDDYIHNYHFEDELNIQSIIDTEIPCYFLNKIDDVNVIVGQQQLEAINQLINLFKNKNREDKLEIIKKNNIQKSVAWCEKFKIPCNKFSEKINIFLPTSKEIVIIEND